MLERVMLSEELSVTKFQFLYFYLTVVSSGILLVSWWTALTLQSSVSMLKFLTAQLENNWTSVAHLEVLLGESLFSLKGTRQQGLGFQSRI